MSTQRLDSQKWRDYSNIDRNGTCQPSQTAPFKIRYQPESLEENNLTSYRLKTPLDAGQNKTCAQALGAQKGDRCIHRGRSEAIIDRDNQDGTFRVHYIDTHSSKNVPVEDILIPHLNNHQWTTRGPRCVLAGYVCRVSPVASLPCSDRFIKVYRETDPDHIVEIKYAHNTNWGQLQILIKRHLNIDQLAQIHIVEYTVDEAMRQIDVELNEIADIQKNASLEVRIGRAQTAFPTFNTRKKPGLRNEPRRGWQDQPEWRPRLISKIEQNGHYVDKYLANKKASVDRMAMTNELRQSQLHMAPAQTVSRFRPMWLKDTVKAEEERQQYTMQMEMHHTMVMESMIPARTGLVDDPPALLDEVRTLNHSMSLSNTRPVEQGTYSIPSPWKFE